VAKEKVLTNSQNKNLPWNVTKKRIKKTAIAVMSHVHVKGYVANV